MEDNIIEFDTLEEFLQFANEERNRTWKDVYPNDFKTYEECKQLFIDYLDKQDNKIVLKLN